MSWTSASNTHSATMVRASNQYFSATDSTSLSVTGNITIEAWVKITNAPTAGQFFCIAAKFQNSNGQKAYVLHYTNEAGTKKLYFDTSSDGSAESISKYNVDLGTATWHHVAVAVTSGTPKFYVDGSEFSATTGTNSSLADTTQLFSIGADYDSGSNQTDVMDGQIDDVRLWNVARTQSQISTNKSVQLTTDTNLKGYWQLNNGLTDTSGNSNTLTNNNGATFTTDMAFTYATYTLNTDSGNETGGAPTEALTLATSVTFSLSETSGMPVEAGPTFKRGWGTTAKSSSSFTNTSKS